MIPLYPFFFSLVKKFAQDQVVPLVQKMDADAKMDDFLFQGLFEKGVCTLFFILKNDLSFFFNFNYNVNMLGFIQYKLYVQYIGC